MPVESDSVILLHGLIRSDRSMQKLENALREQGYAVYNVSYESRSKGIEALAEEAIAPALAEVSPRHELHFVTHSLGGILVRQYLENHDIDNLGRVVMLGPPNKGSEVVDRLKDFPGFRFVHGDAGLELGTGATSLPNRLGQANFDLGVIAGTRSINLFLSLMIPGANDGKVSVESTRLEGMRDHLEMEVTHPFMMRNDRVIEQVIHYLKTGRFRRE
jgi:pimeloyl-ACP methyl ester carboxylesterase